MLERVKLKKNSAKLMNVLIFTFNHQPQAGEGPHDVCDTPARRNSARVHDAKLEVPQEKANGVRERSCLVSGFYLDASGLSIILKSIFFQAIWV